MSGLVNNNLNVYRRVLVENKTGDGYHYELENIDIGDADFIITDTPLNAGEMFTAETTLRNSDNITPKQYNNIMFFETLKAFRR